MAYQKTLWANSPDTSSPISAQNLNHIENGIYNNDVALQGKAEQSTVNSTIKDIEINNNTGVITIFFVNNTTKTLNTNLAKITINAKYDASTQSIIFTYPDGTEDSIPLADFITQYEFENTATIHFTVTDGKVSASIPNGSITAEKLQPNYLAEVESASNSALQSATDADYDAKLAQSYSVGGSGMRENEDTDNAKYYKELAEAAAESVTRSSVTGVKGNAETEFKTGDVNLTPEDLGAVANDGNVSNTTATFTEATERTNIETGETVSTIFGKIKKWFSGLKAHAFSEPIANLLTTEKGYNLDASMGTELASQITDLSSKYNTITNNLMRQFKSIDIDTVMEQCTGYCTGCTHTPDGSNGTLEVFGRRYLIQRFTTYNTTKRKVYIRQLQEDNTWTTWERMAMEYDLTNSLNGCKVDFIDVGYDNPLTLTMNRGLIIAYLAGYASVTMVGGAGKYLLEILKISDANYANVTNSNNQVTITNTYGTGASLRVMLIYR